MDLLQPVWETLDERVFVTVPVDRYGKNSEGLDWGVYMRFEKEGGQAK
jgi:hypothetical protein